MEIISLLIVLAILAVVIIVVTRPIFKDTIGHEAQTGQSMDVLRAEYTLALNRIHELEAEYQEGKLAEEDYLPRRDELKKQAAVFLMKISPPNDSGKEN